MIDVSHTRLPGGEHVAIEMATANRERIGEVTIAARFNGPETTANGGYACGALARFVDEPAEVTLRLPPPLERPLQVVRGEDGAVQALDGEALIAEAVPAQLYAFEPTVRPSFEQALEARTRHPLKGIRHPMSDCFVCGPERADGLGVTPGPFELEADVGGAPFEPDHSVAEDGIVRPEIVWGALDCSSYTPSMWRSGTVSVLGRLTAVRLREIEVGERLVTVGWPIEADGRKRHTASAILDAEGETVARARATWIELRSAKG